MCQEPDAERDGEQPRETQAREREDHDTNGDGNFDRIQHYDESGALARRDEDLDGNGKIDLRTHYRNGRIMSREVLNPSVVQSGVQSSSLTPPVCLSSSLKLPPD